MQFYSKRNFHNSDVGFLQLRCRISQLCCRIFNNLDGTYKFPYTNQQHGGSIENSETMHRTDLRIGEVIYKCVSYNIPIFCFIERFRFSFFFFLLRDSENDIRYNMVEDPILKSVLTQVDFPGVAAEQWNHCTLLSYV